HPPADRIVHQLKYRGWRALSGPMAERMASLRLPEDVDVEARLVVAVPTTAVRLRERGYNQADLIAHAFARRTGRRVRSLLVRRGVSGSQTRLQPASRATNVAGTFAMAGDERLDRVHLLLVDDVLTTGATALECARVLVEAGARCVSMITFARALDARRLVTT
ncbi:MAG: ComF family protein, partial [Longimicrobiales bacterium]